MIEKSIIVSNPSGLHSRPAARFVQAAGKYNSSIWISKGEKKVNAKSIMGLMSLAIVQDNEITISAEGSDEQMAIDGLVELINSGLGE